MLFVFFRPTELSDSSIGIPPPFIESSRLHRWREQLELAMDACHVSTMAKATRNRPIGGHARIKSMANCLLCQFVDVAMEDNPI